MSNSLPEWRRDAAFTSLAFLSKFVSCFTAVADRCRYLAVFISKPSPALASSGARLT